MSDSDKISNTFISRFGLREIVQLFLLISNVGVIVYVTLSVKQDVTSLQSKVTLVNEYYDKTLERISKIDQGNGMIEQFNTNYNVLKSGLSGFDRLSVLDKIQSADIIKINELANQAAQVTTLLETFNNINRLNNTIIHLQSKFQTTQSTPLNKIYIISNLISNANCALTYYTNFTLLASRDGIFGEYYSQNANHLCEYVRSKNLMFIWRNGQFGSCVNLTSVDKLNSCGYYYTNSLNSQNGCGLKTFNSNCDYNHFAGWSSVPNPNICKFTLSECLASL